MKTDWRRLTFVLASVTGLYAAIIGLAADFAQLLSCKHGARLLVLLLIAVLGYTGVEKARRLWQSYEAQRLRVEEVRNIIMRSAGKSSDNVLLCARTLWLFGKAEQPIRVKELRTDGLVVLDISQAPIEPANLIGMHFRIVSFDNERAKGAVKTCDTTQACVELYETSSDPSAGDLAVPVVPSTMSDLDRLLGSILNIVTD